MTPPLVNKHILLVEDDAVFRSMLAGYLTSLGAVIGEAEDGEQALVYVEQFQPELMICDLNMPNMDGITLVDRLRHQGCQIPVIVISATEKITDVDKMLRLGVHDVLLKPISDLNHLREALLACFYPYLFSSPASDEIAMLEDWADLSEKPQEALHLLQQLQPPAQQVVSGCNINYRQLTLVDRPGIVFDIAALSNDDFAFYCLDISKVGNKGVLAALMLRALFNNLLQEHLAEQNEALPQMSTVLNRINKLLHQSYLEGQFPFLAGYYHVPKQKLLVVSAGLHISIDANDRKYELNDSVPMGTLQTLYPSQTSLVAERWSCRIWGNGGRLQLNVTP
ncbi:two-component system response regulator RssB [Pragia fontium]|uniref:two-component system response regulator RssB n=1 Tax=Pragia fontium TaxID=82985 RepID=UPI000E044432|nr:two-component system response regulator RssB [Pragia fontium]SUB82909.1 response regulator of RpoS [Pragia fontium]VEJ55809.1 response regulator of RpoS [Pragia fontium]